MQVRRPDDYDAKKVADLGPSDPSTSLNSLVLSQLKRPPPPPPAPVLPDPPAPALSSVLVSGPVPAAGGEAEDGEVGNAVMVTRVLKLEHMVRESAPLSHIPFAMAAVNGTFCVALSKQCPTTDAQQHRCKSDCEAYVQEYALPMTAATTSLSSANGSGARPVGPSYLTSSPQAV